MNRRLFLRSLGIVAGAVAIPEPVRKYFFAPAGGWPRRGTLAANDFQRMRDAMALAPHFHEEVLIVPPGLEKQARELLVAAGYDLRPLLTDLRVLSSPAPPIWPADLSGHIFVDP